MSEIRSARCKSFGNGRPVVLRLLSGLPLLPWPSGPRRSGEEDSMNFKSRIARAAFVACTIGATVVALGAPWKWG
jgi:hypothetical protein